mmetsp:Transcript_3746/g.8960  ORF Transcript_3746/g.8960 Transcript_3746/m.8960 type:complete len:272 (-) Transcript_3746:1629-2444(-)
MARTKSKSVLLGVALVVLGSNDGAAAFSTTSARTSKSVGTTRNTLPALFTTQEDDQIPNPLNKVPEKQSTTGATTLAVSMAIAMATATTTLPAQAYIPSDYASETVQAAIKDLKSASGNAKQTFDVYEGIAAIITEGKGVGGQINYKGVELNRGYVADEDTAIYNPGLSLLTESEKERLVEGVISAKKAGLAANQWSEENQYAFEFLRGKLDPYHMNELSGFLGFVPYYGAAVYLVVLAVQQIFRDAFQIAYIVGVVAFFAPIVGLVLAGP